MWIQQTRTTANGRPVVQRLKVGDTFVEFSANGTANVPQDIGERLVSEYNHYEPASDDTGEGESADSASAGAGDDADDDDASPADADDGAESGADDA